MIQQLGPFHFFQTYSANDLHWITPVKLVAAQEGIVLSDEEVLAMPYLEKVKWLNKNPTAVTLYIYDVFRRFIYDFMIKTEVFGKVKDFVVKVEFQQRGTPHIHLILWIQDAPVHGVNSDEELIAFIDKYIFCEIPQENDPLCEVVKKCQTHKCLKNKCKRKNGIDCKYNFPKLPTESTVISSGHDTEEYKNLPSASKKVIANNMSKVLEKLREGSSIHDNVKEFLSTLNLSKSDYSMVLKFGFNKPTVIHKRKPTEAYINCYNPYTLRLLESNQDVAFVLSMYGCICYLLSYICKPERNMSKLMKEITLKENGEACSLLAMMKKEWMNKREMGIPEAIFNLLSLPLLWKSREVVYLPADYPEERIRVLKLQNSGKFQINNNFSSVTLK